MKSHLLLLLLAIYCSSCSVKHEQYEKKETSDSTVYVTDKNNTISVKEPDKKLTASFRIGHKDKGSIFFRQVPYPENISPFLFFVMMYALMLMLIIGPMVIASMVLLKVLRLRAKQNEAFYSLINNAIEHNRELPKELFENNRFTQTELQKGIKWSITGLIVAIALACIVSIQSSIWGILILAIGIARIIAYRFSNTKNTNNE